MIFVDTGAWIAILNPNDQYHLPSTSASLIILFLLIKQLRFWKGNFS